jgi:hypothetical protein
MGEIMKGRKIIVLAALLFCSLLVAGAALAIPAATTLDRWVVGGGGGHAGAAPYSLEGTIGQSVVGLAEHAPYQLHAGFWTEVAWVVADRVYLPLVVREYLPRAMGE